MADIALNKLSVNRIAPTLYEKTTLSPVHYLFEFISRSRFTKSYCIPTELSTELLRSNIFNIEDKVNPNPLNGEVDLRPGQYDYNVYEQLSSSNLNPAGLSIVEDGMCRVYDNTDPNTRYANPSVTNTEYES